MKSLNMKSLSQYWGPIVGKSFKGLCVIVEKTQDKTKIGHNQNEERNILVLLTNKTLKSRESKFRSYQQITQ